MDKIGSLMYVKVIKWICAEWVPTMQGHRENGHRYNSSPVCITMIVEGESGTAVTGRGQRLQGGVRRTEENGIS